MHSIVPDNCLTLCISAEMTSNIVVNLSLATSHKLTDGCSFSASTKLTESGSRRRESEHDIRHSLISMNELLHNNIAGDQSGIQLLPGEGVASPESAVISWSLLDCNIRRGCANSTLWKNRQLAARKLQFQFCFGIAKNDSKTVTSRLNKHFSTFVCRLECYAVSYDLFKGWITLF